MRAKNMAMRITRPCRCLKKWSPCVRVRGHTAFHSGDGMGIVVHPAFPFQTESGTKTSPLLISRVVRSKPAC